MGVNSDRRRLPRDHDDHDHDDDHDDNGGPLAIVPVFGRVPLDVVGLGEPVDVDHERLQRGHDHDLVDDHKHDHKHDDKYDDGRPVRP